MKLTSAPRVATGRRDDVRRDESGGPEPGCDDITVEDLSITYSTASGVRHTAVQGIDLAVPKGRFLTIVGPSGCGKTSLLMVLAGLLEPSNGRVAVGGKPLGGPRPGETSIVFQDSCLMPWRTVLRNVALPLEMRSGPAKVSKTTRLARAREALALVGLDGFADRFPNELSGGMKHRVALARGLVTEPSLLLMDEPFAALDEQSRYDMGEELLRVWDKLKITVVFITHSLSEAVFLSDEVVALCGKPGRLRDQFAVDFDRPRELSLMASPSFGDLRGRLYEALQTGKGDTG